MHLSYNTIKIISFILLFDNGIKTHTKNTLPEKAVIAQSEKKSVAGQPFTYKDFTGTYTLNASRAGSFGANTLSANFENSAGNVADGRLNFTDPNAIFLKSKHASRDVEVDISMGRVTLMLRANNDEGYCFRMWDNRQLYISYLKAGKETSIGMVGSINGHVTVGAIGLEIYVKQDGKEVYRTMDLNGTKAGNVIVKGIGRAESYIGNKITVTHFSRVQLLSDTDNRIINPKDLGFKDGYSTGTIKAGENIITMPGHSFKVGDLGFIATGAEADFYGRKAGKGGTIGVGGVEPGTGYATQADLEKANPKQAFSWVWADGKVRQNYDGGWFTKDHPIDFYIRYARPKGLRFRVLAVNGEKVTIDSRAVVTATKARVWHDNEEIFFRFLGNRQKDGWSDATILWPQKTYMFGSQINIYGHHGLSMIGNNTTFITPSGATPFGMGVLFCDGYKQKGIIIESNGAFDNWGYAWFPRSDGNPVRIPGINYIERPYSGLSIGWSNNCEVEVTIKNTFGTGIQVGQSKGGHVVAKYIHEAGTDVYGSTWSIQTIDGAENCVYENSSFESPRITGGAESFGGKNNTWLKGSFKNGRMASNSSQGMKIIDYSFHYTKNSRPDWVSLGEPAININRNTGRQGEANEYGGGEIKKVKFVFDDAVDKEGNLLTCIGIQSGVDGFLIEDVSVQYLTNLPKATHKLIGSNGTNVTVRRCKAFGFAGISTPDQAANIAIQHGILEECEGDVLFIKEGILRNCKAKEIWVGPKVKMEGKNVGEIKIWK